MVTRQGHNGHNIGHKTSYIGNGQSDQLQIIQANHSSLLARCHNIRVLKLWQQPPTFNN